MSEMMIENKNAGTIKVMNGRSPIDLYEHQVEAMIELNKLDEKQSFHSLLVLPTGAGKTLTAVYWLLRNAVDKKKKVLWIAHRHLLLEQAANSFIRNSYSDGMLNTKEFRYRIISGMHDRPMHIRPEDDVIIASKDSLVRNLDLIGKWIRNEDVYLIIDEAHHATAKSYRRIIDFVEGVAKDVKLLGLTATPFRTSEQEKGLLLKIFTDNILYKVDLITLINKKILSTPILESCDTNVDFGEFLGLRATRSIINLDIIPEDIATEIADNKQRNHFIVKQYYKNYKVYGKTLVFAVNRIHAFALKALFEEYGKEYEIKAGVIVSGTRAEFIGIDISNKENELQIKAFRKGEIQILINVNILTEGTDLPSIQTVFLTRPTISSVLMTQMIGRALRGEKAGGTPEAYIVSFVDDWENKVAWINPKSLIEDESEFLEPDPEKSQKHLFRLISISKMEEFARIADLTVDTRLLEGIDFIKRVPLGIYTFSFIEENSIERNHQILVYEGNEDSYENLINTLPTLFKTYQIDEESIDAEVLDELCDLSETFFTPDMIPPYNRKDIEYLMRFFAQKAAEPLFISIDNFKRTAVDLSLIAKEIVAQNLRLREQENFINKIWEDESSPFRVYYNSKYFYKRQLDIEIEKIIYPEIFTSVENVGNVKHEKRDIREYPLYEIEIKYPIYAKKLKDGVYANSVDHEGSFVCQNCRKSARNKGLFQIDHIKPMNLGGLSVPDNLQLLCRRCNLVKGDKV